MVHLLGIIGIGSVADTHARAIEEIETIDLIAASCRTREKGEAFADDYGCTWYADYEAMLDKEPLDAVLVCTPSGAHLEPVLAAAERGVHVLCEKPLEITVDRADRLIEACEETGVRLGGIFQNRYLPAVREVRDAAAAGRFGDLSVVNAYIPQWRSDDYYEGAWQEAQALAGGGALMNQTIHGVDAAQWIAGAVLGTDRETNPVAEVFAYQGTLVHKGEHIEVEDTVVLSLRYRNGALGQILASTSMYPSLEKRIQVGGRDGTAEVVAGERGAWQFRDDRPGDRETQTDDRSEYGRNVETFLDAVAADEPYELDGREARKALAIVEAAYESAERGRPVALD